MKHILYSLPFLFAFGQTVPAQASTDTESSPNRVNFILPFDQALAKAKAENRLLFLKPIYGGVDQLGAKDYCAGTW